MTTQKIPDSPINAIEEYGKLAERFCFYAHLINLI